MRDHLPDAIKHGLDARLQHGLGREMTGGTIKGRVSEDGQSYELIQFGEVWKSYPIAEARADEKLRKAIKRNAWQELPET